MKRASLAAIGVVMSFGLVAYGSGTRQWTLCSIGVLAGLASIISLDRKK
jgi:hypothetical protein